MLNNAYDISQYLAYLDMVAYNNKENLSITSYDEERDRVSWLCPDCSKDIVVKA